MIKINNNEFTVEASSSRSSSHSSSEMFEIGSSFIMGISSGYLSGNSALNSTSTVAS